MGERAISSRRRGEENANTKVARKASRAQSQTKSHEQLELPEGLHRRLTHEALEGGAESFIMLLLFVDSAIKAGDHITAQNLLFRSMTHAYENSSHHVTALMEFRDRMQLRAEALLAGEEQGGHGHD